MKTKGTIFTMIVALIEKVYSFLWGDLIHIPLPGGGSVGISLLIILLIPTGIYFTVRTRLLPIRMFPDMIKALTGKKENKDSLSTFQTLIVSTATRVGMGNLVGVVAAISVGGAGAVFWMWITDGGTVVRTPKEILKTYPMNEDIWKGMCRMVRDELPACDYFAATPDFCFAEDGGSPVFHLLRDSYGFEMREVDDITRLDRNDIIKFTVFHPDKCEELCTPVFIPAWNKKAHLAAAGKEWVDCNAKGVSKWTALSYLIDRFDLLPDEDRKSTRLNSSH